MIYEPVRYAVWGQGLGITSEERELARSGVVLAAEVLAQQLR